MCDELFAHGLDVRDGEVRSLGRTGCGDVTFTPNWNTTSSFISRSATLVLLVPSSLLTSFVFIADSRVVGMAGALTALKYELPTEAP